MVALQALAKFAESTYSQTIDKTIVFSLPDISSPVTRTITTGNRFERFDVEVGQADRQTDRQTDTHTIKHVRFCTQVPSVPSVGNCVRWSGNGTAILQSTVEYHGCNCCGDTRAFSLELASTRESSPLGDIVQLSIRVRWILYDCHVTYTAVCKLAIHTHTHTHTHTQVLARQKFQHGHCGC